MKVQLGYKMKTKHKLYIVIEGDATKISLVGLLVSQGLIKAFLENRKNRADVNGRRPLIKKIIGVLMLLAVFAILLVITVLELGIKDAVIGWILTLVIALVVVAAAQLLIE